MEHIDVAIMMGSKSDAPIMQKAADVLKEFGLACEMRVLSAHRTPKETAAYAEALKERGAKAVICGAGGSAALSGVVAAHTLLPVIGIPIDSMGVGGLDALLSTVQMPPGVPVAGVAIGAPGAKNAALLAIRIMSVTDEALAKKLDDYRESQAQAILATKL